MNTLNILVETFLDTLAKWIWEPILSLIYIEVGILFVYFVHAIVWKKALPVFLAIMREDRSASGDGIVSHKKALFANLSATIGVGNIAGVGTAIHLGGPGALFWMWVSALFGMFFRMAATYMSIKLRPADDKSLTFATPMAYLEKYMKGIWSFIPKLVAGLLLIAGVVLYNMVQSNSMAQAMYNRFNIPDLLTAGVMVLAVGVIILGGMNKIVDYCSALAPFIIILYVVTGLLLLLFHPVRAIIAFGQVLACAFLPSSVIGGVAGYTILQAMQFGVSRGVFSHMSGMGSGTFLQAANKDTPAVGAFMSAITPFVDTVIVCSVTGLVILCTPIWQYETGAHLTLECFEAGLGSFGLMVVVVSLFMFALTTIAGFSYISEKCFKYLGGTNIFRFRIVFLIVTFLGPFLNLKVVWSLSDIIIATLIVSHLLPLLYITLINRKEMYKDLYAFAENPGGYDKEHGSTAEGVEKENNDNLLRKHALARLIYLNEKKSKDNE